MVAGWQTLDEKGKEEWAGCLAPRLEALASEAQKIGPGAVPPLRPQPRVCLVLQGVPRRWSWAFGLEYVLLADALFAGCTTSCSSHLVYAWVGSTFTTAVGV